MIINRPKFKEITYGEAMTECPPARMDYDVVEPKMDGIWGAMHIRKNKEYQIWSRTGKLKKEGKITNKHFMIDYAKEITECVILGEFMHGSHWGKKHNVDGKFFAFDMVMLDGDWDFCENPLITRRLILKDKLEHIDDEETAPTNLFPDFVELNPQWDIKKWSDMWTEKVANEGYEGVILKKLDESYMDATWCKIKARADIDYVCMGFGDGHEGTKYENTVGSIHGGLYKLNVKYEGEKEIRTKELVDVCHVGGLNETQRDFFNKNRDYFKGMVFTAHGYQIFESGAIRHAKFKNFRTDKEPIKCDFSQVPIHSRGKTY